MLLLSRCFFLLLDQLGVLLHRVFLQIFQVLLDVDWLLVKLIEDLDELVVGLRELRITLADLSLVSTVLLLYEQNQLVEVGLVHNQAQDDGLVDVVRGKFVAVALVDHLG